MLESIDGMDEFTYFVYICLLGFILGSVGIDEKMAFGSQWVVQQAFDASTGM
jgi:hypothetical protein